MHPPPNTHVPHHPDSFLLVGTCIPSVSILSRICAHPQIDRFSFWLSVYLAMADLVLTPLTSCYFLSVSYFCINQHQRQMRL